jgi:formylglycine-generating enzyme required for sulfatase activity
VIRGGSWNAGPEFLRTSFRDWNYAVYRDNYFGFRLAQGPP